MTKIGNWEYRMLTVEMSRAVKSSVVLIIIAAASCGKPKVEDEKKDLPVEGDKNVLIEAPATEVIDRTERKITDAETLSLSGAPGILWEASARNCDVATLGDKKSLKNCSSATIQFPLIVSSNKTLHTVTLKYVCQSSGPAAATLQLGNVFSTSAWAPSESETVLSVTLEANDSQSAKIILPSFSGARLQLGCKIELLANTSLEPEVIAVAPEVVQPAPVAANP
jgi:hypothetical protein